jgi:hypothetical protein
MFIVTRANTMGEEIKNTDVLINQRKKGLLLRQIKNGANFEKKRFLKNMHEN